MTPYDRRAAILEKLQSYRLVSGPELQRCFNVGQRTIIRDMHHLRRIGYPVDSEKGYGYMLRKRPLTCCPTCGRIRQTP